MFSGIIEAKTRILDQSVSTDSTSKRLLIEKPTDWKITPGESIAVNGVCLTAEESPSSNSMVFYLSRETLDRTHFSELKPGDFVNLERSLIVGSRNSGHFVQGHVDGIVTLQELKSEGDHWLARVHCEDRGLFRYLIQKGSCALDGVSLTINSINEAALTFDITLIPHTYNHTRFSSLSTGAKMNCEIDMIAKYVEKLCRNLT